MMRNISKVLAVSVLTVACAAGGEQPAPVAAATSPDTIIALERGALDRWGKGDPQGYVEIMAPEVTYFDPFQDRRVDGLDAMKAMLAPITGKVRVDRYDMIGPKVQFGGDTAVLSFNLVSYLKQPDGTERAAARWNTTEVYRRIGNTWKIVHSHFSLTRPELKPPAPAS